MLGRGSSKRHIELERLWDAMEQILKEKERAYPYVHTLQRRVSRLGIYCGLVYLITLPQIAQCERSNSILRINLQDYSVCCIVEHSSTNQKVSMRAAEGQKYLYAESYTYLHKC